MTPNPVSCQEDDDVEQALALMAERQVRRMPVVDAAGRLTGIIAQADVATRVNRDSKTGELVEAISEPGRRAIEAGVAIQPSSSAVCCRVLRRGL